jgi:hypothetical protein
VDEEWAAERDDRFLHLRANIYSTLNRGAEAEDDLWAVLAIMERKLGSGLAFTLNPNSTAAANLDSSQRLELIIWADTVTDLVRLQADRNVDWDLTTARSLIERAVAVKAAFFGPDHEELSKARENLALVLERSGDVEGAKATLTEFVHAQVRETDTMRISLWPRVRLAELLHKIGDQEGSRREYESAVEVSKRLYGPGQPETLEMRMALAHVLLQEQHAEACLEQLATIAEESGRARRRDTTRMLMLRSMLADAYWRAGEPAIAVSVLGGVLDTYIRVLGPNNALVESIRGELLRYTTTKADPDGPRTIFEWSHPHAMFGR